MSAAEVERLPPGTVLAGRFRIERMLGRGGMGAVYGALHLELGQYFAIKILQGEAARDPDSIARFKQEAQIASRLPGPNVVRVHDLGQTELGEPFIVMELLTGRDLDTIVLDPRPIPVADAVNLVCQACLGVATAHANGLVHRDLKPANLFLARQPDGSEIVKVLDFGLSKVLAAGNKGLTQSTSSFGTPQYMAPEQIMSAKHVDARCDQHALGMVLYELLAKKPAFEADNAAALTVKIVTQMAPSVRQARPDVPIKLDDAIQRALAKKPDDRFPDLGAFVQAIAPFGGPSAATAAEAISRGLGRAQAVLLPEVAGVVPGAEIPSLSHAATERSFSSGNRRSAKGSQALFWILVATVITLAAAATGLLFVLRGKGNDARAAASARSDSAVATALPAPAAETATATAPVVTLAPVGSVTASAKPGASSSATTSSAGAGASSAPHPPTRSSSTVRSPTPPPNPPDAFHVFK